jgi:hypothetical protein
MFVVAAPGATPTDHNRATFRLSPLNGAPHRASLDLFVGFGNGSKHAGDATPSEDPREAVPACDPRRSGRALRDGWQPTAVLDTDSRSAVFVSRSTEDVDFVSHVAALLHGLGWTVEAPFYVVTMFGATETPTTASHSGAPLSGQFRNTDANCATHRERARDRFAALMEHGRRQRGG